MTVKEMRAYLNAYQDDDEIKIIAVDLKERIVWPNDQVGRIAITAAGMPVIGLELYDSEPMDAEMVQAAEECERDAADRMEYPESYESEKIPEWKNQYMNRFERIE